MSFTLKPSDIKKLEKTFGVQARSMGDNVRFELAAKDESRKLALEVYSQIQIGHQKGTLISVYTGNAHLQLHFCSGYVVSEFLGEVTFVAEQNGKLSGLIVEREGGCSLFANVDRSLVSGDFTKLGPEVMLSGIALSLTDGILESPKKAPQRKTVRVQKRNKTSRA
jgi:hypothetical protein